VKKPFVFLLAGIVASSGVFAASDANKPFAAASRPNGLQVQLVSELQPLEINLLHAWTIHVKDSEGVPVPGASIRLEGGMPTHNHGLPTRPQVTADLGNGNYRLEGMRFHMHGEWQLRIYIERMGNLDTAEFLLQL
jgi:hypothetical protein